MFNLGSLCLGKLTHKITITAGFSGLPLWLSSKESACNAGDVGSMPGLGRSPGGGNGNPLQYPCLENPKDRGALQLQSMGLQESDMTWRLNNNHATLALGGHNRN